MPSAFLSALFLSLSIAGATAAPAQLDAWVAAYSQARHLSIRGSSNNSTNVPKWAVEACERFSPQCRLVDGVPTMSQESSPKKGKALSKASGLNSSQSTGGDGNPRNTYSIDIGKTVANFGLCNPELFLDILLKRTNCDIGDDSVRCSGFAEYGCHYHDAQQGDFDIPAAPSTDPNFYYEKGAIKTCKMSYQAHFDSNAPLSSGVPFNSTYADYVKKLALGTFRAWSTVPDGAVSKPLINSDHFPWDRFTKLGNFTHYQVPSRIEIYATHGDGVGGDTSANYHYADMVVNVKDGLPSHSRYFWVRCSSNII